jgi:hypothetical protein
MKRKLMILCSLSLLLAACSRNPVTQTSSDFGAPLPNRLASRDNGAGAEGAPTLQPQAAAQLRVVLVPSELVLGPNRFAVGLFDSTGQMVHDAIVHFQYFDLSNPSAPRAESEADAVRLQTPDGLTTIFAHERNFDRAGNWGVEVQARFPDGTSAVQRIGFQVLATSSTLKVGQPVPRLDTPTAVEVNNDLTRLTSASEPNPAFYRMSLAAAMTTGKPTVLLLATPAFCQSRLCGPSYETTSALQKRFGDRLNFVHVEVYTGLPDPAANNWQLTPAMQAFGLQTEPWLYLIDRNGTVVYRVEGLMTADEVAGHIQALLDQN